MGIPKKDRWSAMNWFKNTRHHSFEVEWLGGDRWLWSVHRHGESQISGKGEQPSEKKAKLAAQRFVDRGGK